MPERTRRRKKAAPRRSERQVAAPGPLLKSLDSISEGIQIIDFDYRYLYLNEAAARHGRRDASELVGHTMMKMYPGIEESPMFRELRRCMDDRRAGSMENEFVFPDGSRSWFELRFQPVRQGMLILSIDVTERKRGEEQAKRQAALLDLVPQAIFILDLEGRMRYMNAGARSLYGFGPEVTNGFTMRGLFNDPEEYDAITAETLRHGSWDGEIHQRTENGTKLTIMSRRVLLRDEHGRPDAILVVNADVSKQRLIEGQVLRSQRLESIGTMAGGIAHDLNNVLAPIMMAVGALRNRMTDPTSETMLEAIDQSSKRGAELIRKVLTFARGVEGDRRTVDLVPMLRELASIIGNTFPKNISLVLDVADALPPLHADETQVHQVLLNLCVNARDAMPDGGKLEIQARAVDLDQQYAKMHIDSRPGRFVMVTVTDSGTGMPPGVVDRIFEPFFTTKGEGSGTGLGLSTVLSIVKSHGGFINVYSEVGRGSTFRVYLPVDDLPTTARETLSAPARAGKGELVLAVDDEKAILDITKTSLEENGYRVITAADGTEAVVRFAENRGKVALVITDMMMPYMDGAATIRALRKIDPVVKVLAVGGLSVTGKAAEGYEGVMYLQKPYTTDTLLRAIGKVLDGAE